MLIKTNKVVQFLKTFLKWLGFTLEPLLLSAGLVYAVSVMVNTGNANYPALVAAIFVVLLLRDWFYTQEKSDESLHDEVLRVIRDSRDGIDAVGISRYTDIGRDDVKELVIDLLENGEINQVKHDERTVYRVDSVAGAA